MVHTRQGLAAIFIVWGSVVAAQPAPPLPPPRPSEAPSPAQTPAPQPERPPAPPSEAAAPSQAEPGTCLTELKAAGFDIETAEQPSSSNESCRIEAPVRLKAVPVPSRPGTTVRLAAQPVLACRFAGQFGHWIGDLVAPVIAGTLNTELKSVQTGPGFECRNRNGAATGKLSAHAEGLAIDIAAFEFANGSLLRVKPDPGAAPDQALASLRTAACGWFTTILGPGSDEAHHDHLHVDILQHGSSDRYRICQ
jgi:hypothetical protein